MNDKNKKLADEKDFTFLEYKKSLERVKKYLDEAMYFLANPKSKPPSDEEYVYCMPNCFLVLKRYGLLSQKEIVLLRLENAKLNKEPKEKILELEHSFKEIQVKLKAIPGVLYSMG